MDDDILFYEGGPLPEYLAERKQQLVDMITFLSPEDILEIPEEELITRLLGEHSLQTPVIQERAARIEQTETGYRTRTGQHESGTRVVISIPFEGDAKLFSYTPTSYTLNHPHAQLIRGHLVLEYDGTDLNADTIKASFQSTIVEMKQWLGRVDKDVESHNKSLPPAIKQAIATRRQKLEADKALREGLSSLTNDESKV